MLKLFLKKKKVKRSYKANFKCSTCLSQSILRKADAQTNICIDKYICVYFFLFFNVTPSECSYSGGCVS